MPERSPTFQEIRQPSWLPAHLGELDGLRGLAILGVFFYHCKPRLVGTPLYAPTLWGWSGVSLFFLLSGYLITAILLRARSQPQHYFRNFYMRRSLRVWPLYTLVVVGCWFGPTWVRGSVLPGVSSSHTVLAFVLFVQNLFPLPVAGALGPTWSLAIEEQFYWLWAPVVRFSGRSWHLAAGLLAILIASPFVRSWIGPQLNPTNTLLHLDAIAIGSLIAVGLLSVHVSRRSWLGCGLASAIVGAVVLAVTPHANAWTDSWIALCFGGVVLLSIAGTGAKNPASLAMRHGPLPFFGRISYGLYLTHLPIMIVMGMLDSRIDRSSLGNTHLGNLLIVSARLVVCSAIATALWGGFEKPILKLKRFFPERQERRIGRDSSE